MEFQDTVAPIGAPVGARGENIPFITGLRAISILAVVGFHVGLPGFSGGFIGVDVFFVISGYLIITQIVRQIEAGEFCLADFWARRALRVLPPFALVLAVSVAVASWVLVMPTEINAFGHSVAYASAMMANYFYYWQQGYFDTAANLKPLLHTWTLSVEEQFYLIIPLLLIALFWLQRLTKQPVAFLAATVVLAASLVACVHSTTLDKNAAFFLMPYRAWEFVAGGLVAVFVPLIRRIPDKWCELVAAIGLLAIIVPITIYSEHLLYPSYYAAVPVAGAVILIATGLVQPRAMIARLLATRAFVGIGLVSYSWYLWHWPLLSFAKIYDFGPHKMQANILAAGLSLLLAAGTYVTIERNVKKHRPRRGAPLWLSGSAVAVAVAVVGYVGLAISPGLAHRSQVEWAAYGLPEPMKVWWTHGDPCALEYLPITDIPKQCADEPWIKSFGFLMGDSHAVTAFATYHEEAKRRGIQLLIRADGSCLPILNVLALNKGVPMTSCHDGMRQAISMLKAKIPGRLSFVILKASWTGYKGFPISRDPPVPGASDDPFSIVTDNLKLTIDTFQKMGVKRILVIGPEPMFSYVVTDCLFRARRYGKSPDTCATPRAGQETYERPVITALSDATKGYKNVRFIDVVETICSDTLCPAMLNGHSLYTGSSHMSHEGEKILLDARKADFDWVFGDHPKTDTPDVSESEP